MHGFLSKLTRKGSYPSMFGDAELVDIADSAGEEVTLLRLGESLQSATYHGDLWHLPPFKYIRAFDHIFESDVARAGFGMHPVDDLLLLGGGGFSYPKHVLTKRSNVTMDVVEIDPVIVRMARRHLYLDKLERYLLMDGRLDHLEIFIEDGIGHLRTSHETYDAVINDVFEGGKAVTDFHDGDAIALVKARLNDGGMYVTNFVVDFTKEGPAALNGFVDRLKKAFAHVHIIDACDDEFGGADNYIVIATDADYVFTDVVPFD